MFSINSNMHIAMLKMPRIFVHAVTANITLNSTIAYHTFGSKCSGILNI